MTEAQADAQATQASQRVLALLAAYESGQIAENEIQRAAAVAIYAGKVLATRLADVFVSTVGSVRPLGLRPGPQHLDRLETSAATCLEEPQEASERLTRLAEAEVLTSHRLTLHRAISDHGFEGWREVVAEDACEVCQPFADLHHATDEGYEPHHPRCRCSLVPVGQPHPVVVTPEPQPTRRITFEKQIRVVA